MVIQHDLVWRFSINPVVIQHDLVWRFSMRKRAFPLLNVEESHRPHGWRFSMVDRHPKYKKDMSCVCLTYV